MNKDKKIKDISLPFYVVFSAKEQALFAKRLAFLIRGGIPLLKSLNILKHQTKSKAKAKIFEKLITDVSNGQFLATSMSRFKNIFGTLTINIIKVGETGGILEKNLEYLAQELQKRYLLRRKVLSALIYPVIVTIATLAITILLTVFIFPKILPIFESLNVELPWSTKILVFVSSFLLSYGLYVFLGILILIGAILFSYKKSEKIKLFLHTLLLKLPICGRLMKSYNMANFCRTMGILLNSEVSLIQAISITADTTNNLVYKKELMRMSKSVVRGEKISEHFEKNANLFPDIVSQMVGIGENTGNLADTFMYLSELYEGEVDDLTKNLSSTIEPVLMIVMGLAVGFVAISVITPIYDITQNLHTR